MLRVPKEIERCFDAAMIAAEVDRPERRHYVEWLRYFPDFRVKYRRPPERDGGPGPFIEKPASENRSAAQRRQATRAVRPYLDMRQGRRRTTDKAGGAAGQRPTAHGRGPETPAAGKHHGRGTFRGAFPESDGRSEVRLVPPNCVRFLGNGSSGKEICGKVHAR